jgi:hypothetical protein
MWETESAYKEVLYSLWSLASETIERREASSFRKTN